MIIRNGFVRKDNGTWINLSKIHEFYLFEDNPEEYKTVWYIYCNTERKEGEIICGPFDIFDDAQRNLDLLLWDDLLDEEIPRVVDVSKMDPFDIFGFKYRPIEEIMKRRKGDR